MDKLVITLDREPLSDSPANLGWGAHQPVVEAVRRWHDETHTAVFAFCTERPCADVMEAM